MLPSPRRAVGESNVFEPPLQVGAEEFAAFGKIAPSLFWFVGATDPASEMNAASANHSPMFLLDERSLDVSVRSMLQVTQDYVNSCGVK